MLEPTRFEDNVRKGCCHNNLVSTWYPLRTPISLSAVYVLEQRMLIILALSGLSQAIVLMPIYIVFFVHAKWPSLFLT